MPAPATQGGGDEAVGGEGSAADLSVTLDRLHRSHHRNQQQDQAHAPKPTAQAGGQAATYVMRGPRALSRDAWCAAGVWAAAAATFAWFDKKRNCQLTFYTNLLRPQLLRL